MKRSEIWETVERQTRQHKLAQPNWPVHVVAQAAMVVAEGGDLLNLAIQAKYAPASESLAEAQTRNLEAAAIRTIVTAIRFLEHIQEPVKPNT